MNQLATNQDDRRARLVPRRRGARVERARQRQRSPLRVSASMPKRRAGSTRAEKVTSRAAPIPSNGEPVSMAAAATKNRREREHADEEDHVSRERNDGGPPSEGQEERGDDGRHDRQDGPGQKHPGRRAAHDESLPQELREVEIDLQERRPGAPATRAFVLDDHAQKERREDEDGGEVRDRAHHDELHDGSRTSVTTM